MSKRKVKGSRHGRSKKSETTTRQGTRWRELPTASREEQHGLKHLFTKRARFLVDESLGVGVYEVLVRLGWNAKWAGEVGLLGRSDEEVLAYAWREDRIVLTHDTDFLDQRRFPSHRHPGVIVLPGAEGDEDHLGL